MDHVDVVTISYNGGQVLDRALRSLAASQGVRIRSLVIDNASSDDSADRASQFGATVVRLPTNVGYGAAFNVGLAHASSPWVVCSNQDVEVTPAAVATLVEAVKEHERYTGTAAVAGPALVDAEGTLAETCHELPTIGRQCVEFLAGEGYGRMRNISVRGPGPSKCGWVSGAFILARTSTFRAVGGFDPRYFMYVEDVDLFTRLARSRCCCLWVPAATVVHSGGRSKLVSAGLYGQVLRNWQYYYRVHRGPVEASVALCSAIAGSLLRAILWWIRSLRGDQAAQGLARMFFGASVAAVVGPRRSPSRSSAATSARLDVES